MDDQRTSYGAKGKRSSEQRFAFRQQSPILGEKTGPLHLALVGLTAGWQAGREAGRQAGWQTKYGWISKS